MAIHCAGKFEIPIIEYPKYPLAEYRPSLPSHALAWKHGPGPGVRLLETFAWTVPPYHPIRFCSIYWYTGVGRAPSPITPFVSAPSTGIRAWRIEVDFLSFYLLLLYFLFVLNKGFEPYWCWEYLFRTRIKRSRGAPYVLHGLTRLTWYPLACAGAACTCKREDAARALRRDCARSWQRGWGTQLFVFLIFFSIRWPAVPVLMRSVCTHSLINRWLVCCPCYCISKHHAYKDARPWSWHFLVACTPISNPYIAPLFFFSKWCKI